MPGPAAEKDPLGRRSLPDAAQPSFAFDVISGGRVECGIGRGYQPRENETLGRPYGSAHFPEYEPEEPDWLDKRPWIQGHANQKALLDAFFGALEPKRSLIFVYAKRTPLIDDDQWMIVGVGRGASLDPSAAQSRRRCRALPRRSAPPFRPDSFSPALLGRQLCGDY